MLVQWLRLAVRVAKCAVPRSVVKVKPIHYTKGVNLAGDMEEKAAEWIRGINSEYVASLLAFGIKDEKVLPQCMLDKSVVKSFTSAK